MLSYLKRLKNQAKMEYDRLCNEILQRQNSVSSLSLKAFPVLTIFSSLQQSTKTITYTAAEQIRVVPRVTLKKELISQPLLVDKFSSQREQLIEQGNLFIATVDKERPTISYKNPFDIPRNRLMEQVRQKPLKPKSLHL